MPIIANRLYQLHQFLSLVFVKSFISFGNNLYVRFSHFWGIVSTSPPWSQIILKAKFLNPSIVMLHAVEWRGCDSPRLTKTLPRSRVFRRGVCFFLPLVTVAVPQGRGNDLLVESVCKQITYLEPKMGEKEVGAIDSGLDQDSANLRVFHSPQHTSHLGHLEASPASHSVSAWGLHSVPPTTLQPDPHFNRIQLLCLTVTTGDESWRASWLAFLAAPTF